MACETKWDHHFEGNICIDCGISQMAISDKGFKKIELPKIKQRKITSAFQLLCQDVIDYLHEDTKNFPMFAGVIKRIGELRTRQIISYMRERKINNSHYFMSMTRNQDLINLI